MRNLTPDATKSDAEIVAQANELAAALYRIRGYIAPQGYRFDRATHPQEREAWRMAAIAFEMLTQTDIDDVVSNTEDEP